MFHYLFTNDLRISHLEETMKEAGNCFSTDSVPSASQNKNANNNMNTLGFYFNLTTKSNCASVAAKGGVRKIVLNFIKKFQFPNPRTSESLEFAVNDNIELAPMREIIKTLYMMNMQGIENAFLTRDEITNFIFYNTNIAKKEDTNITKLINEILGYRKSGMLPNTIEIGNDRVWKQEERQIREMVKILLWSGCVKENNDKILIEESQLTRDNKADLFEILTCSSFWKPDMSKKFKQIKKDYQDYMDVENIGETIEESNDNINYTTGFSSAFSRNRIFFGAPGTGKSYELNKQKNILLGADSKDYERVTFHPDYSYANFVGTYKPVPCVDSVGQEAITYEYVPGPFMRTFVNALQNSKTNDIKPFLLIVEEINRANVAAVFGDVFQLLDRGNNEVSEYPIATSKDMRTYLAKEENLGGNPEDYEEIKIPDNMFIWATMNSADQGVYPMDTAFKRRWDFTYLGIDENESGIADRKVILGTGSYERVVEWNELRKAINNELLKYKVNEDKLLGPYFISKKILPEDETKMIDQAKFVDIFKSKVIMYLFDDAAKQKSPTLFGGCEEKSKNQYSKICKEFDKKGVLIFCEDISNQFTGTTTEEID